MRTIPILWSLAIVVLFESCDDCNDCKDLQQKNVLVQDAEGTNLLFGANAVFNPEEATLSTANGSSQPLSIDENNQTLQFSLVENEITYTLRLDANTTEILAFELDERDSERCCGTQTFSKATQVNGVATDNTNTIIIVK